jgi:hypothetical protein
MVPKLFPTFGATPSRVTVFDGHSFRFIRPLFSGSESALGATGAKPDGLPRHDGRAAIEIVAKKTACPGPDRGVRPEPLGTVGGQGFRAVPFDPSKDADETRNPSTS